MVIKTRSSMCRDCQTQITAGNCRDICRLHRCTASATGTDCQLSRETRNSAAVPSPMAFHLGLP